MRPPGVAGSGSAGRVCHDQTRIVEQSATVCPPDLRDVAAAEDRAISDRRASSEIRLESIRHSLLGRECSTLPD